MSTEKPTAQAVAKFLVAGRILLKREQVSRRRWREIQEMLKR